MSLPSSWYGSCFARPPHGTICRIEPPRWRKHAQLLIVNQGTLPDATAGFVRFLVITFVPKTIADLRVARVGFGGVHFAR